MCIRDSGLTPIFCIGEVLEEREAGKHFEVVDAQIKESLVDLSAEYFGKIVLALSLIHILKKPSYMIFCVRKSRWGARCMLFTR